MSTHSAWLSRITGALKGHFLQTGETNVPENAAPRRVRSMSDLIEALNKHLGEANRQLDSDESRFHGCGGGGMLLVYRKHNGIETHVFTVSATDGVRTLVLHPVTGKELFWDVIDLNNQQDPFFELVRTIIAESNEHADSLTGEIRALEGFGGEGVTIGSANQWEEELRRELRNLGL